MKATHSANGQHEHVTCGVCNKEIPKSAATSSEATDYVTYFCGRDCYDDWRRPYAKLDDQIPMPEPKVK